MAFLSRLKNKRKDTEYECNRQQEKQLGKVRTFGYEIKSDDYGVNVDDEKNNFKNAQSHRTACAVALPSIYFGFVKMAGKKVALKKQGDATVEQQNKIGKVLFYKGQYFHFYFSLKGSIKIIYNNKINYAIIKIIFYVQQL